jgi:hypothetical protein
VWGFEERQACQIVLTIKIILVIVIHAREVGKATIGQVGPCCISANPSGEHSTIITELRSGISLINSRYLEYKKGQGD